MSRQARYYWRVEIIERAGTVFRKFLPGHLTEKEVSGILQRLACRSLTPSEIVEASIRKPQLSGLLEVRRESKPHAKRVILSLVDLPAYVASSWRHDEITDWTEILGDSTALR